ncbi:MAG: PAS domain-containing protein, partial [Myxococcota bacterium]|nr:PAS domain-containing protein [Myxococcota bacterium]
MDFRAEVRDYAEILVETWLREDVYHPDGPLRTTLGGMTVAPSEDLSELGYRLLDNLVDEEVPSLSSWLQSDALAGYASQLVAHATQCLIGRVRGHIRTQIGARTDVSVDQAASIMETLWENTDRLYRDVLDYQLRLSRDAMPEDGSDFQDLASVVKDTLYSTLASGLIRYVSPGIEELTGHPASAFLEDQHLWSRLVLPEDAPTYHALYEGVIGTHEPMEAVYRYRHGTTGRVRHVLDRATPVLREGKVVRVDGILIDITDRIELETRVERAEQLRCLGQLARDVAHDFNNLLVSILGHTEQLLAQAEPHTETSEALSRISAAADKGSKLTDRLLAFARGSATSRTKTETELHRVAREAMELARPSVPPTLEIQFVTSP